MTMRISLGNRQTVEREELRRKCWSAWLVLVIAHQLPVGPVLAGITAIQSFKTCLGQHRSAEMAHWSAFLMPELISHIVLVSASEPQSGAFESSGSACCAAQLWAVREGYRHEEPFSDFLFLPLFTSSPSCGWPNTHTSGGKYFGILSSATWLQISICIIHRFIDS